MEKRLGKMEKEIKNQNTFYAALAVIGIAAETASASGKLTAHYQDMAMADFLRGFILGLVLVIEIVSIIKITKNTAALKDETKRKRLYNEMHDERMARIEEMAGKTAIKVAMIVILMAAFVVSYFSMEAFLAMVGVIIAMGIILKICRLYYKQTYTGESCEK